MNAVNKRWGRRMAYQDDGLGPAGLAAVEAALRKRSLKLLASAGYERNTGKAEDAVKAIAAAEVRALIMMAINKPAAAFDQRYREQGGVAQLYHEGTVIGSNGRLMK